MAYIINKFNGQQLVVLEDGTIDTSTSIGLVGRNYVGYGETQNENFVYLLENFANDAPPSRPLLGQIWFDTTDNVANAYDGVNWNPIGTAKLSATAPTDPNTGSLWVDTTANQLKIWLGSAWGFVGPEAVAGFDVTRARSTSLDDTLGDPRPVIILESDGTPFAICTAQSFTINPSNSISGFENNLIAGINLSSTAKIKGDITGNAGSSDRLSTARTINGVPFDGQQNIIVKSSTTNKHVKGTYLTGSDFDGSSEITWSVDATPSNAIGKVVARNSEGGFSAGTIAATFVGNLTGNVTAESGTSTFNIVEAAGFVGATLTGNASSATQLATARKINGVNFNGTSDITVTAAAGTLTGTTLNSTVTDSSLEQLGTLRDLEVANAGISIGSASELKLLVGAGTPTIRSQVGKLNFDMGESGPDVSFVNSATALALGGPNAPAILGDNTTNLGIVGYKFDSVFANYFKGNADTATSATTSTHLAGGGQGAIPYQTAANTTTMLGLGTTGYVLKAQASGIGWEALNTEQLNKGSYVNMINTTTSGNVNYFNSSVPVTISVNASTSGTSNVVARDDSGNFSAGTITASLTGTASAASTITVASETANSNFVVAFTSDAGTGKSLKASSGLQYNPATGTLTSTYFSGTATYASYASTQASGTSNTTIATTAFVQQEIGASRIRSMVITSGQGAWSTTTPDPQFPYLINAYLPASTVPVGTQFSLIINIAYATTSNSVSGAQWINAYQWGTLSVSSTTTLYNSFLGRKLIYQSNGTTWVYTGSWSTV